MSIFKQNCNCALIAGSHFANQCAPKRREAEKAKREEEKAKREEEKAKREAQRQAARESDPDWQRRHKLYLQHKAREEAEAKAKSDQQAAEVREQARRDAEQRLEAQRRAHLRLQAKLEADRKAKLEADAKKAIEEEARAEVLAKEEPKREANLDDWSVPQPGDTLVSWAEERHPKKASGDDASTVASETSWLPQPAAKGLWGLYFTKAEAERLKKVKAALSELHWLQKQVDAGKKMELDRSQFAKIHGKHAEKRRKDLENSDVLRMERAGYQVRERF